MLGVWYFSIKSIIIREKGEVPAKRAEIGFEYSDIGRACMHFVSLYVGWLL